MTNIWKSEPLLYRSNYTEIWLKTNRTRRDTRNERDADARNGNGSHTSRDRDSRGEKKKTGTIALFA